MKNMTDKEKIERLQAPFEEKNKTKWKVNSFSKDQTSCVCVAYIDNRQVQDRLDEVFGFGWTNEFSIIDGHLACTISVKMEDGTWISRTDIGGEIENVHLSDGNKNKGLFSDSQKRAAVQFGPGRYLYDMQMITLACSNRKAVNPYSGKLLYSGADVSEVCNRMNTEGIASFRQVKSGGNTPQTVQKTESNESDGALAYIGSIIEKHNSSDTVAAKVRAYFANTEFEKAFKTDGKGYIAMTEYTEKNAIAAANFIKSKLAK